MPEKLSREEFWAWHRRRMRWVLFLDTSEALLMMVTLLWGCQLVFVARPSISEPISQSLLQVWPNMPLPVHGVGLIAVALFHAFGMRFSYRGLRRRCILGELCFYLYVEASLLLAHVYAPFSFICLAYVLACVVNFLSLLRPREAKRAPCQMDN